MAYRSVHNIMKSIVLKRMKLLIFAFTLLLDEMFTRQRVKCFAGIDFFRDHFVPIAPFQLCLYVSLSPNIGGADATASTANAVALFMNSARRRTTFSKQ